uniref:Peptidase A1 domain-containing protein n=1 Tax=Heterorhabditis bacteriophora TaxID=37862 RepID=A0A1I7X102_HETBA
MFRSRSDFCRCLIWFGLLYVTWAQIQPGQSANPNQNIGLPEAGTLFTGTGSNVYYGGLYNYTTVSNTSRNIPLQFLYISQNTSILGKGYLFLSVNGYIGFATVLDQGPTINVGPDSTDWPKHQDPAMIAPYLCKQQSSLLHPPDSQI